jgi:hypothetical protein
MYLFDIVHIDSHMDRPAHMARARQYKLSVEHDTSTMSTFHVVAAR